MPAAVLVSCNDFRAEFSDISFGRLGADDGWATVVTRTPIGRTTFADARDNYLEIQSIDDYPGLETRITKKLTESSTDKKTQVEIHTI